MIVSEIEINKFFSENVRRKFDECSLWIPIIFRAHYCLLRAIVTIHGVLSTLVPVPLTIVGNWYRV